MNCNISPLFFGYSSKQREQPCVVIVYEMDNLTEITPDEVQIFDFRGSSSESSTCRNVGAFLLALVAVLSQFQRVLRVYFYCFTISQKANLTP